MASTDSLMAETEVVSTALAQLLSEYPEPVRQLIAHEPLGAMDSEWPNYPSKVGLEAEHISDLIRMATDSRFDHRAEDWQEDDRPYWAPSHAVRALGQMQALEAVQPLLLLLAKDDEWMMIDLPQALALMGPAIIPELAAFLADESQEQRAREGAAEVFEKMVAQHPDTREVCLDALLTVFRRYRNNDPELNGMLLFPLLKIKAVEAASLIQEAFEADCIPEDFCGDWLAVKHDLGLALTAEEHQEWTMREQAFRRRVYGMRHQQGQEAAEVLNRKLETKKVKAKRKAAKVARKQNRKK